MSLPENPGIATMAGTNDSRKGNDITPVLRIIMPIEVMDIIFREAPRLTKREILIWLAIWRNTFGENRIKSLVSVRKLAGILKIPYPKIHAALQRLVQKKLVVQEITTRGAILSINLEHTMFQDLYRLQGVVTPGTTNMEGENTAPELESTDVDMDKVRQEWTKNFGCALPENLKEKAAALLSEIHSGNIDPASINFPLNYLKAFIPRGRPGKKSTVRIKEGMNIKFRDEIVTIGPSCCIFYKNGVIPEGEIRQLLEKGEMKIVDA